MVVSFGPQFPGHEWVVRGVFLVVVFWVFWVKHGCLWSSHPNAVGSWAQLGLGYVPVGVDRGVYLVSVPPVCYQVVPALFWLVEVHLCLMMMAQIGTMGIIGMALPLGLFSSYMLGV